MKWCWDGNTNCTTRLTSTSFNLNDLGEIDCRDISSSYCSIDCDSETEIIRCLCDSFYDECKFEEAFPLGLIWVGESYTLSCVKLSLGHIELNLSSRRGRIEWIGWQRPRRDTAFRGLIFSRHINVKGVIILVDTPINTISWITDNLIICIVTVQNSDLIRSRIVDLNCLSLVCYS